MENEKPTLDIDPEKLEQLVEAIKRVWVAVKEMTEIIAAWWQEEIAPQLQIALEQSPYEPNDYSSLVEALQKLSELSLDFGEYYRDIPKRKHRTPYKRSYQTRLFDKRSRVHHCRNNC